MSKTPNDQLWSEEISGTYWTTPRKSTLADVHPLLMAVVLMLPGRESWSIFSADVFDMLSGGPIGSFDIAFDPRTARACGYFDAVGSQRLMTKPVWFRSVGDESDVVQAFCGLMRDAGHVE